MKNFIWKLKYMFYRKSKLLRVVVTLLVVFVVSIILVLGINIFKVVKNNNSDSDVIESDSQVLEEITEGSSVVLESDDERESYDSTELTTEITAEAVIENTGVWLTSLEYVYNNQVVIRNNETGISNTGVNYKYYLFASDYYSESEIEYYLNGKYKYLSGIWTICQQDRDTKNEEILQIYADDELVYESPVLTGGDLPIYVNVDIKNCNVLKIVFPSGTSGAAEFGDIWVDNKQKNVTNFDITQQETSSDQGIWLTDIEYLYNDKVTIKSIETGTSNTGVNYKHYLFASDYYGESEVEYYLDGKYKYLSGIWAICQQDRDTKDEEILQIYADDELVYESPVLTGGDLPISVNVDIKNCNVLKIVFPSGTSGAAEFGDIWVDNKQKNVTNTDVTQQETLSNQGIWLTDIEYLYNNKVTIKNNETGTTNTGVNYKHYLFASDYYSESEVEYYLDGKYKYLSGIWTICQQDRDTKNEEILQIYADDELVYESPVLTGGDLPIDVNVDINNCNILKIVFPSGTSGAAEFGDIWLE